MWQALIPLLGTVFDRVLPDPTAAAAAKLQVMELAQKGELAQLSAETQLAMGQVEVNKAEASSGSAWAAGWRPLVGYVCAVALAWDMVLKPLGLTVWVLAGHPAPVLPDLSSEQLYSLLFGLLGLGSLRSFEKAKGVA